MVRTAVIASQAMRVKLKAPARRSASALACGLLAWAWVGIAAAQAPALPVGLPDMPTPAVGLAPAPARALLDRHEIRAQLMPRRYTTVAAEIGAKISQLPFQEGAAFRAGDKLVGFDCSLQQAQLDKAQAELESAGHTFKSNQRLAELNSVGMLELDLSRAAVAKARAEVSGNQAVLSKCNVAAPFSGRIAEQKAREQQFVQPGQPLLDIIDDSVLELEFLVPSNWLSWLRPGGAVLWYDFTMNNPRNPDVRGVPLSRVRALFPGATIDARRVTLAPPLARPLCRLHPLLYPVVNAVPLLRTHRLAWIEKPHE
jgi:multidrug efflux pump subunit AcrA (membrane-fusion protein)